LRRGRSSPGKENPPPPDFPFFDERVFLPGRKESPSKEKPKLSESPLFFVLRPRNCLGENGYLEGENSESVQLERLIQSL